MGCYSHCAVSVQEVLSVVLRRHGRVLGEKLATELIRSLHTPETPQSPEEHTLTHWDVLYRRYARKVATLPSQFGEEVATAAQGSQCACAPPLLSPL